MLPFIHGTCVFPYQSYPCQLVGKIKPNSQRGEKKCFISFKNNLKLPELPSHHYGQSYIVPPPNKQNPQGGNT